MNYDSLDSTSIYKTDAKVKKGHFRAASPSKAKTDLANKIFKQPPVHKEQL